MTQRIPKPENLAKLVLSIRGDQVFDAVQQLIAQDKTRKAKPPISLL
jgi:hypothetical protein